MDYKIRPASLKDINEIKEVIKDAFSDYNKKTNKGSLVAIRSDENIKSLISECSDGSIIIEENNEVVGVIFCHLLGDFSWFGPLAVKTKCHKKGYGKILVKEAISYFKKNNVKNISLATMVDAPWNISLYSKMGFVLKETNLHFMKILKNNNKSNYTVEEVNSNDIENLQDEIAAFLNNLTPNKDFNIKLDNYIKVGKDGNVTIFIVRNKEDEKDKDGQVKKDKRERNESEIKALGIYTNVKNGDELESRIFMLEYLFIKDNKDEKDFLEILTSIENYSRSKLKVILNIAIRGSEFHIIRELLKSGHIITKLSQVMQYMDSCDTKDFNFASLLG